MRKHLVGGVVLILLLLPIWMGSCTQTPVEKWNLVWSEEFEQTEHFDTLVWSKVPRSHPDWKNYMSDYDSLYAMQEGNLVLRGIVNTTQENDTATYLTGGIWSKDKKMFNNGRIEVRAKLDEGIGVWPAIWMLPEINEWPNGGEIDIMEHLNHDSIIYQTVHSNYTVRQEIKDNPKSGTTHLFKSKEYNVYAVEMYTDSISFFVNDVHTFTYPRIETEKEGQFPFSEQPFYVILSMQLGGAWVGHVNPKDLPVEMHIDWVRFYELNKDWKSRN